MTQFILNSKLSMPVMGKVFSRLSLLQRLQSNLDNPLSVICAPSGYGKTTLLSDFLQQQSHPYCWLSLDEKNNVGSGFWRYLCAAIKTVDAKVVETAELYLQNSYIEDYSLICDALLESLEKRSRVWNRPSKLILVLDEFQFIDHPQVLASFNRFLDYLPNWLHVMITSRAMPDLNIPNRASKLLAQVILSEELVIPREQVADFLYEKLAVELSPQQVDDVYSSTEGWAAAIQLFGLSIKQGAQGQTAKIISQDGLLDGFLFDDVFQQLSSQQQQALLVVSVLQQFNGEIVNAMLHVNDGQIIIEQLLAAGLFVTPLDQQHREYRLHGLFKEWLIEKFSQQDNFKLVVSRGFQWLTQYAHYEQALMLAVGQQDWPNAAAMMVCLYPSSAYSRHQDQALRLLALFPLNIVQTMPHLAMMQAVIASQHYQYESLQHHCTYLENALHLIAAQLQQSTQPIADTLQPFGLQNQAQFDLLNCGLWVLQGQLARTSGQRDKARLLDEKILQMSDIHNASLQCWAAYGSCADAFMDDDMHQAIEQGQQAIRYANSVNDVNCEIATLAWLLPALLLNGQIKRAEKSAQEMLEKISLHGMQHVPNQSGIYLALVQNLMEQNRLDEAWQVFNRLKQYLSQFPEVRELTFSLKHCHVQLLALSGLQDEANKELEILMAFELTEFSGQGIVGEFNYVTLLDVNALQALMRLKEGNAMALIQWAQMAPTQERHLCVMRLHYEQFIYAIAQSIMGQDMEAYLIELNDLSKHNGALHRQIGIAMLPVRMHLATGQFEDALNSFAHVLTLAAPHQFVNLILDGTANIETLLTKAIEKNIESRYCQFLLSQSKVSHKRHYAHAPGERAADYFAKPVVLARHVRIPPEPAKLASQSALARPPVEQLTVREKQILQLLSQGDTNQQMADTLELSVSTVKRHLQNIYAKLQVKNRTAAIAHLSTH